MSIATSFNNGDLPPPEARRSARGHLAGAATQVGTLSAHTPVSVLRAAAQPQPTQGRQLC